MRLPILLLLCLPILANAQGPVTPPGPPGATMRSLDQIEPRIPLVLGSPGVAIGASGTITISQPGSYFLTKNLTVSSGHGIVLSSNDVTLDLRGFTISSSSSGGFGVNVSGATRVSIFNGSIRGSYTYTVGTGFTGSGLGSGIDYDGAAPVVVRVKDVSVEGVASYGIDLSSTTANIVESCVVRTVGIFGIRAGIVSDSAALIIGNTPISGETVSNCIGRKADGTNLISNAQPTIADVKEDTTAILAASSGETRTPIATVPFTISSSGSYFLTANLTVASGDAITITADDVTLDLNGFTIRSTAANAIGTGIAVNSSRVTVFNGHVSGGVTYNAALSGDKFTGPGFSNGIEASLNSRDLIVHHVTVNGCDGDGIRLPGKIATVVHDCTVNVAGANGIVSATVTDSSAIDTGGVAITATNVSNSQGTARGTGFATQHGIQAESALNCFGSAAEGSGISAAAATNCSGFATIGNGIRANIATGCQGISTSGVGLYGGNLSNCYGTSNTVAGIQVNGTATGCTALTGSGGTAMTGLHAMGCTVQGGTNACTYKDFCH